MGATAQQTTVNPLSGNSDWKVDWTNTITYSANIRTRKQSSALTTGGGNAANYDDGDRNFNRGLVSNRFDLFSELDAVYQNRMGLRISGEAWYDSEYHGRNDNPGFAGGAVPNRRPPAAYNSFTSQASTQMGRQAELRDAFVFGKFGESVPVTVRAGQHSVVWGESLFFAGNAIAGAQNAFDISRLLSDPTAQAKQFVLPVPQVSTEVITGPITWAAYYQFQWRPNEYPPVGSYFSSADIFGPGGQTMWVGPGAYVNRLSDQEPATGKQGGLSARWNMAETDLGLYILRFDDHTPQIVTSIGPFGPTGYRQSYHQGSTLYGASASHTFGNANVAIEASIRNNASLASSGGTVDMSALFGGPRADNSGNPAYAIGRTANVNLSTIWSFDPNALFRESNLAAEFAWNRMLSCEKNCDTALDPKGTRNGYGVRMVFTPTYRQVIPGLDLSIPIGVGWAPRSSRPLGAGPGVLPPAGGGDLTIGAHGVYDNVWDISLQYTHYYGGGNTFLSSKTSDAAAAPYTWRNTLVDRDFIALNIKRSF